MQLSSMVTKDQEQQGTATQICPLPSERAVQENEGSSLIELLSSKELISISQMP